VALAGSREAKAGFDVSYSTSGSFIVNGQTGSSVTLSSGNLTVELTYTGANVANLSAPTSTAPFGMFNVKVDQAGDANENVIGSFDILLQQTLPSNAQGMFTADVSGKVKLDTNRQITISFDSPPNPITLDGITYTLPSPITLNSPAESVGAQADTALTVSISGSPVVAAPEPPTVITIASGVGALSLWRLRRPRRRA
jgi:hypothetical protein